MYVMHTYITCKAHHKINVMLHLAGPKEARVGDHVTNIVQTQNGLQKPIESQPKPSMRNTAKPPQVQIPGGRILFCLSTNELIKTLTIGIFQEHPICREERRKGATHGLS